MWRLPLGAAYDKLIDTPNADMKNIAGKPVAGSIVGAQFMKRFIKDGTPWAHLDIAGTAWKLGPLRRSALPRLGDRLRRALAQPFDREPLRRVGRWLNSGSTIWSAPSLKAALAAAAGEVSAARLARDRARRIGGAARRARQSRIWTYREDSFLPHARGERTGAGASARAADRKAPATPTGPRRCS